MSGGKLADARVERDCLSGCRTWFLSLSGFVGMAIHGFASLCIILMQSIYICKDRYKYC